jgi:hypothetical protein
MCAWQEKRRRRRRRRWEQSIDMVDEKVLRGRKEGITTRKVNVIELVRVAQQDM